MYIMTACQALVNLDQFQSVSIRGCDRPGIIASGKPLFDIYAIGKKDIEDCYIIDGLSFDQAMNVIYDLYEALEKGERVWDVLSAVDAASHPDVADSYEELPDGPFIRIIKRSQ